MERIKKNELLGIITSEIPEVNNEIDRLSSKENIAGVLQIVVTFTRELLKNQRWAKVNWNMMLIGWVYDRGDEAVKDMIENVFVRSFNGMQNLCGQSNWQLVQKKIPISLYSIYLSQNRNHNK